MLGRVLFGANRLAEAEAHFLAARTLGEETGDHIVLGEMLNALAVVAGRRRRHTEALDWFDRATVVHREIGATPRARPSRSATPPATTCASGSRRTPSPRPSAGLAVLIEIGSGAGMARARYHLGMCCPMSDG